MPLNDDSSTRKSTHILVALVENKPGVLNRVASLFRRRSFNIESLTVGHTESPEVSRMTIVVDTSKTSAALVEKNLNKLIKHYRNGAHRPGGHGARQRISCAVRAQRQWFERVNG